MSNFRRISSNFDFNNFSGHPPSQPSSVSSPVAQQMAPPNSMAPPGGIPRPQGPPAGQPGHPGYPRPGHQGQMYPGYPPNGYPQGHPHANQFSPRPGYPPGYPYGAQMTFPVGHPGYRPGHGQHPGFPGEPQGKLENENTLEIKPVYDIRTISYCQYGKIYRRYHIVKI